MSNSREEALRILEACDPGDCGCGQAHKLPEGSEDLVEQMVELLEKSDNQEWWESVDTSTMDYLEYGAFEDSMTPEEYKRYTEKKG